MRSHALPIPAEITSLPPVAALLVGLLLLFFGRKLFWLFVGATGFIVGLEFAAAFFPDGLDVVGGAARAGVALPGLNCSAWTALQMSSSTSPNASLRMRLGPSLALRLEKPSLSQMMAPIGAPPLPPSPLSGARSDHSGHVQAPALGSAASYLTWVVPDA